MSKKVTPWPNGLGWCVKTARGPAVVADVTRRLSVSIPMPPRREAIAGRPGKPDYIEVERRRLAYVPLGTDPVEAVRLCRKHGKTFDLDAIRYGYAESEIPEVTPPPPDGPKTVSYAFPSSPIADRHGAPFGCWYVAVEPRQGEPTVFALAGPSQADSIAAAMLAFDHAETLPGPYGRYSFLRLPDGDGFKIVTAYRAIMAIQEQELGIR